MSGENKIDIQVCMDIKSKDNGKLRLCIIKDKICGFHRWSDKAQIVQPSFMTGGHGGGVIKETVGIIEYEDGIIHECYPTEICFIDGLSKHELKELLNKKFGKEVK